MGVETVVNLLEALRGSQLLSSEQLQDIGHDVVNRWEKPVDLARDLVARGWLTRFQAQQAMQGRGSELVLGAYRLLERLGEGGMGQVYKARHRKMNRVVALKVIRRDKLGNADAIRRFFREVQAAATLDHPNIVVAYDADKVGDTYFFAMEYVDGHDLAKLVKQKGRLKLGKACEYMRQAALGLQHAHGKGMVHRDIKPSNIIVRNAGSGSEAAPLVKILDMGLARVSGPLGDDGGTPLTQVHTILGTPDFIAPEQARSSHEVDIRSDLYSLGCTFYYILTGQVPFPAQTPMEKLLKHYLEEPPRVEALRPEVPRGVAALVRKLMAKSPDQRPQSPAEVVQVLGTMVGSHVPPAIPLAMPVGPAAPEKQADPPAPEDEPAEETVADVGMEFATSESIDQVIRTKPTARRHPARRQLVTFAVLGAVIGLMLALLALFVRYALR